MSLKKLKASAAGMLKGFQSKARTFKAKKDKLLREQKRAKQKGDYE
jgi:hypothetical protein